MDLCFAQHTCREQEKNQVYNIHTINNLQIRLLLHGWVGETPTSSLRLEYEHCGGGVFVCVCVNANKSMVVRIKPVRRTRVNILCANISEWWRATTTTEHVGPIYGGDMCEINAILIIDF